MIPWALYHISVDAEDYPRLSTTMPDRVMIRSPLSRMLAMPSNSTTRMPITILKQMPITTISVTQMSLSS